MCHFLKKKMLKSFFFSKSALRVAHIFTILLIKSNRTYIATSIFVAYCII